jgi:NADPH:quinone reductase-like Zn-dependent oxidoreductase
MKADIQGGSCDTSDGTVRYAVCMARVQPGHIAAEAKSVLMGTVVDGATAVVTGGQKGLGKAIVDELLARGATTVYATSRRPEATIDQRVLSLGTDITDDDSVTALAHAARDATIVVNNAGLLGGESLLDSDLLRRWGPVNVASVLSWLPGSGPTEVRKQRCGRRRTRCVLTW